MASPDVEVSPSDLKFRFQLNKQLLATITINNPNSQRVAFKIKTTAPKKYVVRPSSGVVEPRSNVNIQVIMQAQKEYLPEFTNCKDKFMVQTTALAETEQIDKDTFSKEARKDLKEYRLRVTIEGPPAPPSPVFEAPEGEDDIAGPRPPATVSPAAAVISNVVSTAAPPAPVAAPAPAPAADTPPVDNRLRSVLESLTTATVENQQLKAQVEKLVRDRDDLRRQLDAIHLQQGSRPAMAPVAAPAAASPSQVSLAVVILAALLAFVLGHWLRF